MVIESCEYYNKDLKMCINASRCLIQRGKVYLSSCVYVLTEEYGPTCDLYRSRICKVK